MGSTAEASSRARAPTYPSPELSWLSLPLRPGHETKFVLFSLDSVKLIRSMDQVPPSGVLVAARRERELE